MRKLFNIFLFVLCTIAIAGCNDTESSESKLEIKAVNTNFQATGGKGYIQLQSTGNITADVDVDWCVLKEVNPNEVRVGYARYFKLSLSILVFLNILILMIGNVGFSNLWK